MVNRVYIENVCSGTVPASPGLRRMKSWGLQTNGFKLSRLTWSQRPLECVMLSYGAESTA